MKGKQLQSRILRLLSLVREIKTRPEQPPKALYETLGISKAQLSRDKDILEGLGFVFNFNRAKGCYDVEKDCFLPMEGLSLDETLALVLAVGQLTTCGDYSLACQATRAARKLVTGIKGDIGRNCASLMEGWDGGELPGDSPTTVRRLEEAINENRRVRVSYKKPGQEDPEQFEIDPYLLFFKDGLLYLDAFSLKSRQIRTYRVRRIGSVKPTPVHFDPKSRSYSYIDRYRDAFGVFTDKDPQEVVIRFSPKVRPYIEEGRWHHTQTIQPEPDGAILFSVMVAHPSEVLWWAMKWGDGAEVLKPEPLRQEAATVARRMSAQYD